MIEKHYIGFNVNENDSKSILQIISTLESLNIYWGVLESRYTEYWRNIIYISFTDFLDHVKLILERVYPLLKSPSLIEVMIQDKNEYNYSTIYELEKHLSSNSSNFFIACGKRIKFYADGTIFFSIISKYRRIIIPDILKERRVEINKLTPDFWGELQRISEINTFDPDIQSFYYDLGLAIKRGMFDKYPRVKELAKASKTTFDEIFGQYPF